MASVQIDLAGLGHVLQPDGHVARLPHQRDRRPRLASTTAGPVWMPTHGFSSSVVSAAEPLAEGLQVVEEAEAGPGGAACGVLVGHRVAEARQQPLLVALHDRPIEPAHGLLAGLLEGPQHLGLVLRVEFSRYASDSNRSQPQTRTVTWRRSASRARRRDEVDVEDDCGDATDPDASGSPVGIDRGERPDRRRGAGPAAVWHARRRSSAKSAAVV